MVVLVAIAMTLSSCSDKDDIASTPYQPDSATVGDGTYTIMFYGCSDSKLDNSLQMNLWQVLSAGKKDRVNFRGLVKFSAEMQKSAAAENIDLDGVRLVTYADTLDGKYVQGSKAYDNNYRLDNPRNLADFITDTKRLMPADNYILVLWDHGDIFGLNEKPVQDSYATTSRAMLMDTHNDSVFLSTYELEEGLRLSGTKMKLVYFDCCLMGMVESFSQIKDYAEYGMGAVNLTPGYGGNYVKLVGSLQNNATFEDAMKEFVPATVSTWRVNDERGDLSCFNLAYIDQLSAVLKNVAGALNEKVDEFAKKGAFSKGPYRLLDESYADEILALKQCKAHDDTTETAYFSRWGGAMPVMLGQIPIQSTDISTTLGRLVRIGKKMTYYSDQIDNIFSQMTVAGGFYSMPPYVERMSMGITWPTYAYIRTRKKYADYVDNLRRSAFNKATGWVDFLESPISAYSIKNFGSVLGDPYGIYAYLTDENQDTYGNYQWTVTLEPAIEGEDASGLKPIQDAVNTALKTSRLPIYHASQGLLADIKKYVSNQAHNNCKEIKITLQLSEGQNIMPGDAYSPTSITDVLKLSEE